MQKEDEGTGAKNAKIICRLNTNGRRQNCEGHDKEAGEGEEKWKRMKGSRAKNAKNHVRVMKNTNGLAESAEGEREELMKGEGGPKLTVAKSWYIRLHKSYTP